MAGRPFSTVTPLTLSLSPWERGRCCTLRALFRRPFSHGEKDRMRGGTPDHDAPRCDIP